jgi:hypothetical protein
MSNWKRVLKHSVLNLDSAGTAQQLSATELLVDNLFVQAQLGNTGQIVIGDSDVSVTDYGVELNAEVKHQFVISEFQKGDAQVNLATIFFDGGTSDDKLIISYWV